MKKLLIILVLFIPKVLMAYECDFDKLVPGKTKKQLDLESDVILHVLDFILRVKQ